MDNDIYAHLTPTYKGEKLNQGKLIPMALPKLTPGGHALLKCGGTEVILSYTALHLITGWLAIGAHKYDGVRDSNAIIRAFCAITCEAGQDQTPKPDLP